MHASQVLDPATGLGLFGPGTVAGPVWSIKDISARYAVLFNGQKASALLGSASSPITNGCGKQKIQQLQFSSVGL
jgi:hypothetical protein